MAHLAPKIALRLIPVLAVSALLMGTASAQLSSDAPTRPPLTPGLNLTPGDRQLTPEELEKRKAVEDAYKSAIGKIPDKKKSVDPWENIRPTSSTSSKAK